MIAVEETTIHYTRGDATNKDYNTLAFEYPIFNLATREEEKYKFQPEDKITFVVINKKGYTQEEILRKEYTLRDIGYTEPSEVAELPLTEDEMKNFPLSNKRQTFWYEISLNDSTTILGYDDTGAKEIIIYPEYPEA